jgi:hypothetical protein
MENDILDALEDIGWVETVEVWDNFSRDRAVGMATGYGLDDGGVGVRVPVGSRIFFMSSRPVPGAHRASCPVGTGGSFPRGKAVGAWSWPFTSN